MLITLLHRDVVRRAARNVALLLLILGLGAASAAAQTGLVAAYSFNEGTGTTVADLSGNGNVGTVSATTWTTAGKYGGALSFNGTSSRVTIPDAPSLRLTTAMTLEAWVRPSTSGTFWRDVVYKGNDNYYLEANSSRNGRPAAGATISGNETTAFGTATIPLNVWTHLAATYDGTTMRLFVNGAQVASATRTGTIATSANPLQIGGDNIFGQFFRGLIDEVRVYNVALTAEQLQNDMATALTATPAPDLTLTKTHSGNFAQGQIGAVYTLTARNGGTAATSGSVTVTDTLPASLTATALAGAGWTCSVATVSCSRSDTLAAGANYPAITLTVNVAGSAPASVTNTAAVTGGGETNTANNGASNSTTITPPLTPDLTLTKTHVGNFTQGQNGATYTLTASNGGTGATNGAVTVTDTLPASLTATAMSGIGWTCTVATTSCTRSDALAAGSSYPAITLTVNVASSAPASVTNTAAISGGGESNTANNSASNATTINPPATPDLTLSKTHIGSFVQGQSGANYTLTVSNSGTGATSGLVTVTDTLPAGLAASALSGTGWTCTTATLTCTRSDALSAGASYPVITLTVTVASGTPSSVTNTAAVSGGGEINTANDTATDVTIVTPQVSANGLVAAYAFNEGTGTTVTDISGNNNRGTTLGTTWTAAGKYDGALSFNGSGALVTIPDAPSLRLTTAMTLEAWIKPSATNSWWQDVIYKGNDNYYLESSSSDAGHPAAGGIFAGSGKNTFGTAVVPLNAWTHLAATYDGATLRLYVNGVQVSSIAQTGSLAASANPLQIGGDSIFGQYFEGLIDEVRVYNVALTAAQVQSDMATAIGATPVPDLTLTKTHAGSFAQGQAGATYTLSVRNSGTTATSGPVTVTDTLPASLTVTAIAGSGWTCTETPLACTRSDALAGGAVYPAITVTVNVSSSAPGSVTNTAAVSGGGETNTANDTASDLTTITPPPVPDLTLSKTHAGPFTVGQLGATYTLTVSNAGTDATIGAVTVTDLLPASLVATDMTGGGWSCTVATATCTRSDSLSAGAAYPPITMTVDVASTAPASVTNTATVGGGGEINTANDTAIDVTAITIPDTEDPSVPGTLTAVAVSGTRIDVSWGPATDNVGVVGYRLERCQGANCTVFTKFGTTITGTSFSDTSLSVATSYSYIVRAQDAAGNLGPYSNVGTATTLATNPSLVTAYSFDEGTGTVVNDASGNGHTGTIQNATWTAAGKYGKALVFNGANAKVVVPDAASLHLTTGMTLEAWVLPAVAQTGWVDVIYKATDNYYLEASTNPGPPGIGITVAGTNTEAFGTAPLTANVWKFLSATYDGSTLRFYVDGAQVSSQARTGSIVTSTSPLEIGGDSVFGQFFQGVIDEIRVYNAPLTPAQIQADMGTPLGATGAAVTLSTSSIDFGAQTMGTLSTPRPLTITNSGTAVLNLESLTMTGTDAAEFAFTSGCPGSLAPAATCTINMTFTPTSGGAQAAALVISDNAAGNPHRVALSGVGSGLFIAPRTTAIFTGQAQPFTLSGAAAPVTWSVDNVPGGSPQIGTVTSAGVYTAPLTGGTHVVSATDGTTLVAATVYVTTTAGVYTHRIDNARTGQNLNETALTLSNVNSAKFGKLSSYAIDGIAHASPLYVANVNIPAAGLRNVVYVATEHDSVYAFDADGRSSAPLWKVSFINPAAGITSVPNNDTGECCDITPEIGITGTPVIDPATGTLYVVAKTKEPTNKYVQRLHALDLATGAEKFGGPVVIQASVPGTGTGSLNGTLTFNSLRENQRTALLLRNGVVYFGFGSHGDVQPYHGWLLGYDATTLQQVLAFCTTPNGEGGGVWQSGGGLAVDSAGNFIFATGDGTFSKNTGGVDYGNTFLRVSPTGTVLDFFTPQNQGFLDNNNLDLDAGGMILLPDQSGTLHPHILVSSGKDGSIYVVDRDNMGGFANPNRNVQTLANVFPFGTPLPGNYSSPVYYNGTVYFAPVADVVQAFRLSNGLLPASATTTTAQSFGYPGAALAISANGAANGILWAVRKNAGTGTLHAYDASNLAIELYTSDQAGARDTLPAAAKFSLPLVVNGHVYVASETEMTIFGLLP